MPRYNVTVKRWGDYEVDADTAVEAEALAETLAKDGHSPDSDTYHVEAESVTELRDDYDG